MFNWIPIIISIVIVLFGSGLVASIFFAGSRTKEQKMNLQINKESIQRLELSVANLTTDNITTKITFSRIEETLKNILDNQKETIVRLDRIENRKE